MALGAPPLAVGVRTGQLRAARAPAAEGGSEVGRSPRVGLGRDAAVPCPVERAITPPTPAVTRAPGRFHRLSALSSQGFWGHRLVQLRANSTAGNKQQASSQLVSWAPALLRAGAHHPNQAWAACFLLWMLRESPFLSAGCHR